MATEEHDREDLLRDAKMMPLRAQATIDDVTVVVGFRGDGQVSLYFGPDPVFQFNSKRELRRVFYRADRYAAENGCLVKLIRSQRGGKVEFQRESIDAVLRDSILCVLSACLRTLNEATEAEADNWQLADSESEYTLGDFLTQLRTWLESMRWAPRIAKSANA